MSFKKIKNTSTSGVEVKETGDYVSGNSFITIYPQNYDLWADAIETSSGLVSRFQSGQFVVSDDYGDFNVSGGINFLKYPHYADNIRFKVNPLRDNYFVSGTVQEAIEEIDFRKLTSEPTGFADRTQSTMSFTNSSRTFSIGPVSSSYDIYSRGRLRRKTTTETITITDTEGVWFFYFNDAESLVATQTPWSFGLGQIFIAAGYWDFTNKLMILFEEERHGLVMDWATHQMEHNTEGLKVETSSFTPGNYVTDGNGSLDSHCQLSLTNGTVNDEDIRIPVTNSATPTGLFEQKLSTIAWLPVYYRSGASGVLRKITATAFPVASNSPNTIYYNSYIAGSWGLTNVTNNYFTAMWIVATNNYYEPIIAVLGQYEAPSFILAATYNQIATLNIYGFGAQEYKVIWRVIVQSSTSYTNTPKAAIRGISDATNIIPNNDRYAVLFSYNGAAGTGKYSEIFPGQDTSTSPFIIPEDSFVRTITLRTTALSSGAMGFYRFSNLTTPFYTMTFTNQNYMKADLTISILANEGISIKTISGSFSKPHGSLIIQTGL